MKEGRAAPRNRHHTYRDSDGGPVAHTHAIRLRQPYFSAKVPAGQTVTIEEWHRQNNNERIAA